MQNPPVRAPVRARVATPQALRFAVALAGLSLLAPSAAWSQAAESDAPAASDPAATETVAPPALSYVIVDGVGIADPLTTDVAPDIERGRQVFESPERGNCVACHRLGDVGGGSGPALDGVGLRRNTRALRLWVVNPAALSDAAEKPAYFSVFDPPADAEELVTRLTAREIEDLVAFLAAQR